MSETVLENPSVQQVQSKNVPKKEATIVIYRMVKANTKVEGRDDTPLYPPYRRVKNTDTIVWKDEEGNESERAIRYLRGWDTIFVDEQEKNGRVISENTINNPQNFFEIVDGELKIQPHEAAKLKFWEMCNHNVNSEHKTGRVAGFMAKYSEEDSVKTLAKTQEAQKKAMDIAYAVKEEDMYESAQKAGIPLIDINNGASRTPEAITADFRQLALSKPDDFLKIFGK